MNTKDTVLVVGASGTVGRELSALLKNEGYPVREATSKTLNLATGEGVRAAFEDVDRAFFLAPPGYADQHRLLSPLIQEAKRRGLKKVVLMTAMGADASESTPFRRAELELEKSGLSYNIIRPNWFLQNFNTFWLQGIKEQNKIQLPAGRAKVSFIDARDIAAVAAELLASDRFDRQAFDLTGPEAVDHAEVAAELSRVTGSKIEYQEIEPDVLRQGLVGAGVPEDYAGFLLMIFGFLKEGYNARLTSSVREITGREPRSLRQYANDYKGRF